jgi:hypothetical protein
MVMKPRNFQPTKASFIRAVKIIYINAIFTAITAIGVLGFPFHSNASSKKNLPAAVASSFSSKYGNTRIKKWSTKEGEYFIRFINGKQKCVAFYTSDGVWQKTEIALSWAKDLPLPVRDSIEKDGYAAYRVDGIKEVLSRGQPLYVLHIDDGPSLDADHYDAFKEDYILSFSSEGILKDKREMN